VERPLAVEAKVQNEFYRQKNGEYAKCWGIFDAFHGSKFIFSFLLEAYINPS
jgi:hypothetical protein